MKLFLGLISALVMVIITNTCFSQQLYQDVIILKSGKEVRGVIQERVDGEYVKIRSRDNRTLEIPYADIERITQEVFEAEGLKKDLLDPYFMKNKHDYWSLATGIGPSYGGFGLRFQQRFGRKMGFGYHAGLGVITGGEGFRSFWGYSAGFKFFPYKAQFIDLQYGTVGILYQEDYLGNIINQEVLFGPSVLLGGDWFFSQYFGMNGSVGASFNVSHPEVQSVFLVIEMGLMVKFK